MPSLANITVKKNDGTTDVIYTGIIASGGDRSPAVWQNQTVGTAPGHRPTFKVQSRENGTGSARRVDAVGSYPSLVVGGDGKTVISDKFILNISAVVPQGMATADVNEAASQFLNVCASVLFKDMFKSGYAAT